MENIIPKIKSIKITRKDILEGLTIGIVTGVSLLILVTFDYALIDFIISPELYKFEDDGGLLSKIESYKFRNILFSLFLIIEIVLSIFSIIKVWKAKYLHSVLLLLSAFFNLFIISEIL